MKNGDHFVGEIKLLEVGQLEFKASYMASSVNLDWAKVAQIESIRRFRVEFSDGTVSSGIIAKDPAGDDFTVENAMGPINRGYLQVVSIEPLEASWWRRLEGSADLGLTLNPEGGQTQYSANAAVAYPSERFRVTTQANSIFSRQEGSEDSIRNSFSGAYYQFLSREWFLLGMTQLLKDNQLNLSLRASVSGGGGSFLSRSTRKGLAVFGGIASTYEKYFDTTERPNSNNAEILTGMEFYTVRFASSNLTTKFLLYSGITQWGRERIDWETSISWEVVHDFFWRTSVLENFDSRPPEGLPKNDFTLTSSFGLSF